MERLRAELIRKAQLEKLLGAWYSIAGIRLEFLSIDANFLYGNLQNKKESQFGQVEFKSIYSIDDKHQLEFAFVSDFIIGQRHCTGAFKGVANLTRKNPIIKIKCLGEIIAGKDYVIRCANMDFSKSLKCFNFEDYPVHEENGFFDPF